MQNEKEVMPTRKKMSKYIFIQTSALETQNMEIYKLDVFSGNSSVALASITEDRTLVTFCRALTNAKYRVL